MSAESINVGLVNFSEGFGRVVSNIGGGISSYKVDEVIAKVRYNCASGNIKCQVIICENMIDKRMGVVVYSGRFGVKGDEAITNNVVEVINATLVIFKI